MGQTEMAMIEAGRELLILKRASASRPSGEWNDDDFDVLANGEVVHRIFKAKAAPSAMSGSMSDLPEPDTVGPIRLAAFSDGASLNGDGTDRAYLERIRCTDVRSSRTDRGAQVLPPARATVPPWLLAKSARVSSLLACYALGPRACAAPCSCHHETCSARSAWPHHGKACPSV
jgi:hypothetical protein